MPDRSDLLFKLMKFIENDVNTRYFYRINCIVL